MHCINGNRILAGHRPYDQARAALLSKSAGSARLPLRRVTMSSGPPDLTPEFTQPTPTRGRGRGRTILQQIYTAAEMPFGGFRESGYGKELSGPGVVQKPL